MCLENQDHVQLSACAHEAYHLRVGNTTLHLTQRQVIDLQAELNRCVRCTGPSATLITQPGHRWPGRNDSTN